MCFFLVNYLGMGWGKHDVSQSYNWWFLFYYLFAACRILVPWPGIEPMPPTVEVLGPNYWTAGEFPNLWNSLIF